MGLTVPQLRRPCPRLEQTWRSFAGRGRFPPVSFVCSFSSPLHGLTLGPPAKTRNRIKWSRKSTVKFDSFGDRSRCPPGVLTPSQRVRRSDLVSEGRLHRRRETARFPKRARQLCWADRVGRRVHRRRPQ